MSTFDSYGYRPGKEPLPRDEPTEIGSPVYCWMKTGELAVSYTPNWVCPRCHIGLRYPFSLCSPCGRFGDGSARFEAGGEIKIVEANKYGRPTEEEPAS